MEEAKDLLDVGIMDVYDRTLTNLDRWGISVDHKTLKRREMAQLLNETSKMNSTLSNM